MALPALALWLAHCGGDSSTRLTPTGTPEMSSEQEMAPATTPATTPAATPEMEQGQLTAAARCELPAQGYSPSCDQCLAAKCCELIEACKSDAECAAQVSCIVRCQYAEDPASCSPACIADQPHPGYLAYDDCSFERCLDECWSD